ncbi:hypothetical protein [Armatimonas sp.]|uniref:hypothetical protein n=1 Tax=Armatimonas sp. TaxID=1872638 RepID=UPI00374D4B1F
MKLNRRGMFSLMGGTGLLWLAGCGGGASTPTGSVTRATQERVGSVVRKLFSGGAMFGAVDGMGAVRGNATAGMAGGAAPPSPSADISYTGGNVPQLGAFLKNMASDGPVSRAKRISRGEDTKPDIAVGESMPPYYWEPQPTFYFDYYLGLWTQTSYKEGESRYDLYEDEAKTKPAGEIVSTWPTSWETFPQVWKSSHKFTAGFLKGAHGSSENITNAGWSSGSSKYENVYADGWKDKGASNWGTGGSSWFSRSESEDGKVWNESAGSWRNDGSGGTRMSTSDGYEAIFTNNPDGSGRGTVKGTEAGLPATITWDNQGNVTIRYADGTVERFNRWGIYGGGGGGYPVPMILEGDGGVRADTAVATEPKL